MTNTTAPLDLSGASEAFLKHLKSLYPCAGDNGTSTESPSVITNPWYIIAIVAFASCNRPEAVPVIFVHTLQELEAAQRKFGTDEETSYNERLRLARRIRESLLKASLLCGAPRTINGMIALHEAMPEDLREKSVLRNTSLTTEQCFLAGERVFRSMYGNTADGVQNVLNEIYPDFGWLTKLVGYGMVYGQTDILTQVETSYILVAGVIGMETPRQFGWHLANTRHGGASLQEAKAVRQICIEVAEHAGVQWKEPIPDVE
ncbi:hypothetical protein NM688_g5319 [Phlebia brevispora]|uniref:Uncharacterized protein n=1 Tax=Phlebia brevispora TaxID=194682 RepID=A0ACC1SXA6_9APHY|nr:hypothetical protein NM688_g5319 [Phlebia brevispora]